MASTYIPVALRRQVIERAHGRCEYCQCSVAYATESFDVEHIIPISRGGNSEFDNLAFACSGCNGHKYNKIRGVDPSDQTEVELYHPRRQRWRDHFGWDITYTQVVGLSTCGRATIAALQMNRLGVINLRRVLVLVGSHPPPSA